MNKGTFKEVLDAHEEARKSSSTIEEFQRKWSEALARLGWNRKEFHDELYKYNKN